MCSIVCFYIIVNNIMISLEIMNAYATGMVIHCKYNNIQRISGFFSRENTLNCVINKCKNFANILKNFQLHEIILASYDVLHAVLKMLIVNILPERIYCNKIIWMFIFFLLFPTCNKLGLRYKNFGCIKNHKNLNNLNHNCNYKTAFIKKVKFSKSVTIINTPTT